MTFYDVLEQVIALLQRHGQVTYRALKRQFEVDDDYLADLKEELIKARRLAVDQDGELLVWDGGPAHTPSLAPLPGGPAASSLSPVVAPTPRAAMIPSQTPIAPEAERRQLTVMFCDLVDSTALAARLDPEDWREVVRAYQETCTDVIERLDGHVAQYLGDGLLVYFGYPRAHEDDAQRAVHTGLALLRAIERLNLRLHRDRRVRLALRVGIHTGLVVVGEIGSGEQQQQLALGETPNIAARIQGRAVPDTVVISAATAHLVQGYFAFHDLGSHPLKGVGELIRIFRVLGENAARSRFDVASAVGLTPLVGREQEVALLLARWGQAREGHGHVVLLNGEAGIGKSRLVQVVKDHAASAPHVLWACQCSPYAHTSAFYPIIDMLQRLWHIQRHDTPEEKVRKLERVLAPYVALQQAIPLIASLLAVPLSAHYAPLKLSPEQHKRQTFDVVLTLLLAQAAQQPVLLIVEDLHLADASTLDFLSLVTESIAGAGILTLLTFRPHFQPPWALRAHLTALTLSRLPRHQVESMIAGVTGGKALPPEVQQELLIKTDGVPLFVEELTKMVLESRWLRDCEDHYELTGPLPPLAIPATLQDSLMARLDRLGTGKAVVQLGATLGRVFSYEVLQAISPLEERVLRRAIDRLVQAELLYQQGEPPHAMYVFKHAMIQESAYQALLKVTRRQYHERIAQVLTERFPDMVATQPELLAHHYTEAALSEPAVHYWQQAGERAIAQSAHVEAISHLRKGLEVLAIQPDTPERAQTELHMQIMLGPALMAVRGQAAPEVEEVYARAHALCQQVDEAPQVFPVLRGLWNYYLVRGELGTAAELGEALLTLAERLQQRDLLTEANWVVGVNRFLLGEFVRALTHLQQGLAFHDPQRPRSFGVLQEPDVGCLCYIAQVQWYLGYPDQARASIEEALSLAQTLGHPYNIMWSQFFAAYLALLCRDAKAVALHVEAVMDLAAEQSFRLWAAVGMLFHGWALEELGQSEEGMSQMRQGLEATRATETVAFLPFGLGLLAGAYGRSGQTEEGLAVLAEALALVEKTGERRDEVELYRLQGELHLNAEYGPLRGATKRRNAEWTPEACFLKALDMARCQEARIWELRAAMSLCRLWQGQGRVEEARQLLGDIYGWFTEGFDTPDLREARAWLETLRA